MWPHILRFEISSSHHLAHIPKTAKTWPHLNIKNHEILFLLQTAHHNAQWVWPTGYEFATVSQLFLLIEQILICCRPGPFLRALPTHHQRNG